VFRPRKRGVAVWRCSGRSSAGARRPDCCPMETVENHIVDFAARRISPNGVSWWASFASPPDVEHVEVVKDFDTSPRDHPNRVEAPISGHRVPTYCHTVRSLSYRPGATQAAQETKDHARPTRPTGRAGGATPVAPHWRHVLLNPAINSGEAGVGSQTGLSARRLVLQPPPDNSRDRARLPAAPSRECLEARRAHANGQAGYVGKRPFMRQRRRFGTGELITISPGRSGWSLRRDEES